jgi:hypothetical protein
MELYKIVMDVMDNIANKIPLEIPVGIFTLGFVGLVTNGTVRMCKNTKKANAHFQELQNSYKSNFSKEELIPFFEDFSKNVGPYLNPFGKRRKIADRMTKGLQKQIMTYATQEVQEAIGNGAVLDFEGSIKPYSPTYKNAIQIVSSSRKHSI